MHLNPQKNLSENIFAEDTPANKKLLEPLQTKGSFFHDVFGGKKESFQSYESAFLSAETMQKQNWTEKNANLYAAFIAFVSVLIAKLSGNTKFCLGISMVDNSSFLSKSDDPTPFPIDLSEDKSFIQFQNEILKLINVIKSHHEDYLGLISKQAPEGQAGETELFETIIIFKDKYDLNVATVEKYNLAFVFKVGEDIPGLEMFYKENAYSNGVIKQIHQCLINLINNTIADNHGEISRLEVVNQVEKHKILCEFNRLKSPDATEAHYLNFFDKQVKLNPKSKAVVFEKEAITYLELSHKADAIAANLIQLGVIPGAMIGLLLDRSIDMMVGIIGIMKAGCAYLPIDTNFPVARVEYIIEDSKLEFILTTNALGNKFSCVKKTTPFLLENCDWEARLPEPVIKGSKQSLAYVIYTSASTGNPKGVQITHSNLINFIIGMQEIIPFEAKRALLMLAPISFDLSISETLLPLASGMTVVIANKRQQEFPEQLNNCIIENNVSHVHCTPSRLRAFLTDTDAIKWLQVVKHLMVGGEALSDELFTGVKALYKNNLYNLYGPTETTVWSTFTNLTASKKLTIGKPIRNTSVYILDYWNNPQPLNTIGELCIGGDGVSIGYLNNFDLTQQKFVDDIFEGKGKMYRTGDLAKWDADGNIEYCGRADHQIKIRGYRIELKEIESQIKKIPGIKEVVVTIKESIINEKVICAYYTCEYALDVSEIKLHLISYLPEYMIPGRFFYLEKLPITHNGKIDFKSLPDIVSGFNEGGEAKTKSEQLINIWNEILNVQSPSKNSNFFELGGNSLSAILFINKVWKKIGVKLPMSEFFKSPNLEDIIRLSETMSQTSLETIPKAIEKDAYLVSPAQKRMFILQFMDPTYVGYNMPAFFELDKFFDVNKLQYALNSLVNRHESLRTKFVYNDDGIFQIVSKQADVFISETTADESDVENEIQKFVRPFSLDKAPLLRLEILSTIDSDKRILMFDTHHIISDGVSKNIFFKELVDIYHNKTLSSSPLQYKDYSEWLLNNIMEGHKSQEKYWLNIFSKQPPLLEFPFSAKDNDNRKNLGAQINFSIDVETISAIKRLCENLSITPNILYTAVYTLTVSKYSQQNDITIGTIVAGRKHPGLEGTLGVFANFLPLRFNIDHGSSFLQFVVKAKEILLAAYDNQDYPFEQLVEKLGIKRNAFRNPLFDTMIVIHNEVDIDLNDELKTMGLSKIDVEDGISLLDLKMDLLEINGGLKGTLFFKKNLLPIAQMNSFVGSFKTLIAESIGSF